MEYTITCVFMKEKINVGSHKFHLNIKILTNV